jgi:hypothetical protein
VYFTAPVNGGGSAITNYSYTLTGANPYTACSPTVTTSPITISGLTNGRSYDIRLRAINSTGSGINSNLLTGTPTASIAISSSGNISDQPVSSATILTVNSGAELTVNQNTEVSSITVAPGAKLTLNDGVTLSTTGSFTLQNSGTETASFVDNRTDVSPTAIAANVEQAITETNRNWYVAVPVTGQTAAGITLSGAYVVKRNEGAVSWENVTGALTPGVGYIAIASASSGTTTWTLSGGNLNSGKVEVPVTRSGASSVGFNLLGNPYASYLNWEQVLNLNATNATLLQPSIWYRTKVGASYAFQSYNSTGRVAVPTSTSGYIPPMQAFWVRANSAGNVTFTNAMRSHGNGSSNVLKAPKSEIQPLVRLQLSNTQNSDEAVLYFNSNASNAVDNYDTYKMLESATATKPEIYTQVESEKLVINGMTSIPYNVEIPIGIVTRQAGDFSIAVNELSNFEADSKVLLIDKLNPAFEVDLTSGTPYNFSAPETSATTDRFSLLFRAPGNTTSLNNTDKLRTSVYVNSANKITIIAPEKSNYSIFNSVGQLVDHGKTIDKIHVLNLNKNTGIFVVKVNDVNERIIIK